MQHLNPIISGPMNSLLDGVMLLCTMATYTFYTVWYQYACHLPGRGPSSCWRSDLHCTLRLQGTGCHTAGPHEGRNGMPCDWCVPLAHLSQKAGRVWYI